MKTRPGDGMKPMMAMGRRSFLNLGLSFSFTAGRARCQRSIPPTIPRMPVTVKNEP